MGDKSRTCGWPSSWSWLGSFSITADDYSLFGVSVIAERSDSHGVKFASFSFWTRLAGKLGAALIGPASTKLATGCRFRKSELTD